MVAPVIPTYAGDIPLRTQAPAVFSVNVDSLIAYIPTTVNAINVSADFISVENVNAASNALSAQASADVSAAASDFKGRWSDATGAATAPSSYNHNNTDWRLLQNISDITTDEPSETAINWLPINGINMGNIDLTYLTKPMVNLFAPNNIEKTLKGNLTSVRSTTATYIDRYGVLQTVANNELRVNEKGVLIEGDSANLFLYSGDGSNAVWDKGFNMSAVQVTDPRFGLSTDWTIDDTSSSGATNQLGSLPSTDTKVTLSFVIKPAAGRNTVGVTIARSQRVDTSNFGTAACNFTFSNLSFSDISNFVGSDAKIEDLGDGYFFVSFTVDVFLAATQSPFIFVKLDDQQLLEGTSRLCAFQLEEHPFATSYIPTLGSPVTRAADDIQAPVYNNLPPLSQPWTFSCEVELNGSDAAALVIWRLDDANEQRLIITESGDIEIKGDGVKNDLTPQGTISNNISYALAVTYNGTSCIAYVDGVGFPSVATPFALTSSGLMELGSNFGTSGFIDGSLKNARWFDTALTADEVKLI